MKFIKNIFLFMIIIMLGLFSWYFYKDSNDKVTIQFFPINTNISFSDIGSNIEIFKHQDNYKVVAESWSKTSEKVYLRQDVNLLFQNGYLKIVHYPWKEQNDWMIDKIEAPLEVDSIYLLLSYHYAEIHQEDVITSSQAITSDRLYVTKFQNNLEAFKQPINARQKDVQMEMVQKHKAQRKELLQQGIKELNINQENYEIYDLDTFSLRTQTSKVIKDEQWDKVLGGLWEGLYRSYILAFSSEELEYFSPPMPWVLVDKNGTHLLVILQQSNGQFEKLIQEI